MQCAGIEVDPTTSMPGKLLGIQDGAGKVSYPTSSRYVIDYIFGSRRLTPATERDLHSCVLGGDCGGVFNQL